MRVFVGLGEGIGNVVMGLPLLDAVRAAGHAVGLSILPTPPAIEDQLTALVVAGRPDLMQHAKERPPALWDAACLTYWWLFQAVQRRMPLPRAKQVFLGAAPSDDPEILANLEASRTLWDRPSSRAALHWARKFGRRSADVDPRPKIAVHPGCKPDPEWKRRKVYPRWAEVVHRLKDGGADVVVVGTGADTAYCGEPHGDTRAIPQPLPTLASWLAEDFDVVVSGDSGIHHMAVALGLPTVVLFGESSIAKATHPDPFHRPVVLGPGWDAIDPQDVARAALAAVVR